MKKIISFFLIFLYILTNTVYATEVDIEKFIEDIRRI